MRAYQQTSYGTRSHSGTLARAGAATIVALALLLSQAGLAAASTSVPAVDTGGSGGSGQSVSEMLRGNYSPVDVQQAIAITEVQSPLSVAEMIRGDLSPVDAAPEIAVVPSLSVADQIRGDLSVIPIGDV